MSQRDWPEEIEYLLHTHRTTLTALAAKLGVTKQQLSAIKEGRASCPPMLKFKILDMKGYAMTRETLLELLPADVANVIREKDNERIANLSAGGNDKTTVDV